MKQNNYYITTPIYYPSGVPHMGHAYSSILADVFARFKRNDNYKVHFLTGTDEHGLKVQEAAEKRNVEPKVHVDEYVKRFQDLWRNLYIEYDGFIRTSESRHTERVTELLNTLFAQDEIYLDEYEGLYSVSEERFVTD